MLKVVALFTRAWIEIGNPDNLILDNMSPSSRGRGLKYDKHENTDTDSSRPLHEGVD